MMSDSNHIEIGQRGSVRFVLPKSDASGAREWTLLSGLVVTSAECDDLLTYETRQLDPFHAICLISSMSSARISRSEELLKAMEQAELHQAGALRDYQFVDIIRRLLDSPKQGTYKMNVAQLIRMTEMVTFSLCEPDADLTTQAARDAYFMRAAFRQSWDQEETRSAFARGLLVTRRMFEEAQAVGFALDFKIAAALGMEFNELLFIGFALFAETTEQPGRVFTAQQFSASNDFEVDDQVASKFFKVVGAPMEDLGVAARHPKAFIPGFEHYAITPLTRWPAVQLGDGQYVVPIPRLLLSRLTVGLYYDALQGLPELDSGSFGNAWGRAFELYVGDLFEGVPGIDNVFHEPEYVDEDGTRRRACDWIVRCGNTAILIECKTRGLTSHARITGLEKDIRPALHHGRGDEDGSSLAGGLIQLMRTRSAIEAGRPGLEELSGIDELVCVLVTLDHLYEVNSKSHFQRILLEECRKIHKDLQITPFQVSDAAGFESLLRFAIATESTPAHILMDKMSDDLAYQGDFTAYFRGQGVGLPGLPVHARLSDRLLDEIVETFRRA